jgi:excisionase family DNA binding protein
MKRQLYYVYTLTRPNGEVFYVGKGTGDRIDQHEHEAELGYRTEKCDVIRQIWSEGGQVVKRKVYETTVERDALLYEWSLLNLVYGRENLTNQSSGHEQTSPAVKPLVEEQGEVYLTFEETLKYLGVTRDTLDRYAKAGRLTKYRRGLARRVYFKQSELDRLKRFHSVGQDA